MKGLFRRHIGAILAASTLVGAARFTPPVVQPTAKASTTKNERNASPSAAFQQVVLRRIVEDRGGVLSYGAQPPIWVGKAKARKGGKARWDYRR